MTKQGAKLVSSVIAICLCMIVTAAAIVCINAPTRIILRAGQGRQAIIHSIAIERTSSGILFELTDATMFVGGG
jgi:hypothetical protein